MTKDHKIQVLKDAIRLLGIESQVDKVIEEMAELTQALLKYRRLQTPLHYNEVDLEKWSDCVCEEIADVDITLSQLKLMMGRDEIVEFYEGIKMKRLEAFLSHLPISEPLP